MTSELSEWSAAAPSPQHQLKPSDLQDLKPLGQGPGTRVWQARDAEGQEVLLKTFSLAEAPNWKAYDLFEREAQVLQHLVHPQIPRLLAYGREAEQSYLIYAYVPGESLESRLADGWRPSQGEALALIRQLLDILLWLHARQPPIVHRDIKPSNLILTPEGQLFLIDFGAVLLHLKPNGGSTVAGTFGYMAPEQLTGRSLPASDLYSVGATLIHLLSGQPPSQLPQERLWIRFEQSVQASPALAEWIRSLIHPVVEERCPDASTAMATLEAALQQPGRALAKPRRAAVAEAAATLPVAPPPLPYGDLTAIQAQGGPGWLDIRLPERVSPVGPRTVVGNLVAWGAIVFALTHMFGFAGHLPLYLWVYLGMIFFSRLVHRHRASKQSSQAQTRLILSDHTLAITQPDQIEPLELPWQAIRSIYPRGRQHGLRLRYRDPLSGRRRRLRIGRHLQSHELAWLLGVLQSQAADKLLPEGRDV